MAESPTAPAAIFTDTRLESRVSDLLWRTLRDAEQEYGDDDWLISIHNIDRHLLARQVIEEVRRG